MSVESKKEIQLEIAHVLFIDIVDYSKLSINEQRSAVDELTRIVRATEQFQKARRLSVWSKLPPAMAWRWSFIPVLRRPFAARWN